MPSERSRVEVFLPIRTDIPAYQIVTEWLAEELPRARGERPSQPVHRIVYHDRSMHILLEQANGSEKRSMPSKQRTRVEIFLPVRTHIPAY